MPDHFSLADAFGPIAFDRDHADYALCYALGEMAWGRPMENLSTLVDPNYPGAHLGGEPGWSVDRQMEPGEARLHVARLRTETTNYKPNAPVFAEPAANAGPDPSWPEGARFKVELAFPDEFGNPKYPLRYYNSATFERFLQKILSVYVKSYPDSKQRVEEILGHARYWVDRDSVRARST